MSVHQLHAASLPVERVAVARGAVTEAASVPADAIAGEELAGLVSELAGLEAQVAALKLDLVAEADRRNLAEDTAAADTGAWAAGLTGTTRGVMSGGLWLARLLRERYHATRVAFATGRINEAQMRVIVRAAETLPDAVSDGQREVAETDLVAKAVAGTRPDRLRQAARRMLEKVDHAWAERHEADQLAAEESRAEAETWLALHDNGDGTFSGRFTIPELHGQLLRTYLERLTAPRRLSRNKVGELVTDPTLPGQGPTLSWTEKLGLGFTELLEHLPTHGFGPVGAQLLIHLDHDRLRDGLGAARLDTGQRLSVGATRRLACNAGLIPAVLGGDSEILDLGRTRRLHTTSQRRALSIHHESCAAEGCQRPFAWCDIHHPHPWADGGETNLANAIPLCGHHHRRAHDSRYTLRYLTSGEVRYRRRR